MPVSLTSHLRWADVSASAVTDAVPSVVTRGMLVGVAIVAGPAEGPATTSEDDVHASGLEEVLIGYSTTGWSNSLRETYVVPRVDESDSPFSAISFARFTMEN